MFPGQASLLLTAAEGDIVTNWSHLSFPGDVTASVVMATRCVVPGLSVALLFVGVEKQLIQDVARFCYSGLQVPLERVRKPVGLATVHDLCSPSLSVRYIYFLYS